MCIKADDHQQTMKWMGLNSVHKHFRNDIFEFLTKASSDSMFMWIFSSPFRCPLYKMSNKLFMFQLHSFLLVATKFLFLFFSAIFCPLVQIYSWEINGIFVFFLFSSFIQLIAFYFVSNTVGTLKIEACFVSLKRLHPRKMKNNCSNLII